MALGPSYEQSTGQPLYVPTPEGANAPARDCDKTCCDNTAPPVACNGDSTCNNYCDGTIKQFSRGPDCPCPCPGRLGYPPLYLVTWSIGLISGDHGTTPGFNDDFPTFTASGGSLTVKALCYAGGGVACYLTPTSTTLSEILHRPDEPDNNPEYVTHPAVGFNGSISECGKKITFTAILGCEGMPSTDPTNAGPGIAHASGAYFDRCGSGSIAGVTTDRTCRRGRHS